MGDYVTGTATRSVGAKVRERIGNAIDGLTWLRGNGCEWAYLFGVKLHIDHMGDEIEWSLYGAESDDDGIEYGHGGSEEGCRADLRAAAVEHFAGIVQAFAAGCQNAQSAHLLTVAQLAEATADRDALRERLVELASQMPGGINDNRIYSEETVRVRIAVAVGPNGHWGASGWCVGGGCADADDVAFEVAELDYEAARLSYVEADVPLPTPDRVLTVEGKVAREGEGVEG